MGSSNVGTGEAYTDLPDWEDNTFGDLVTAADGEQAVLMNHSEPFASNNHRYQGSTTSTLYFREVVPQTGFEFDPTDGSGILVTNSSNNAFYIREDNFRMKAIGIECTRNTTTNTNAVRIGTVNTDNIYLDRLYIFYDQSSATGSNSGIQQDSISGSGLHVNNTIVRGTGGSGGFRRGFNFTGSDVDMRHCAAHEIDQGANSCYGMRHTMLGNNAVARSNISMDCRTNDWSWTPGS